MFLSTGSEASPPSGSILQDLAPRLNTGQMAGSYRLARVAAAEGSVLARHGKPIAPLVRHELSPRRQLGWLQGGVDEAFCEPCSASWRSGYLGVETSQPAWSKLCRVKNFFKTVMMICFKSGRVGRLGLATTAGLLVAVLDGGSARSASWMTSTFSWNGMGTGGSSGSTYKNTGTFDYDNDQPSATIAGTTASGFRSFVINSLFVDNALVSAFTPKQVVDTGGNVANICSSTCSLSNFITFDTATKLFLASPQSIGVVTGTPGNYSTLQYGEQLGVFSLALDGAESVGTAESTTGLTVPPTSAVPGPLPIVGASMAWGLSRRLRTRMKLSGIQLRTP